MCLVMFSFTAEEEKIKLLFITKHLSLIRLRIQLDFDKLVTDVWVFKSKCLFHSNVKIRLNYSSGRGNETRLQRCNILMEFSRTHTRDRRAL